MTSGLHFIEGKLGAGRHRSCRYTQTRGESMNLQNFTTTDSTINTMRAVGTSFIILNCRPV